MIQVVIIPVRRIHDEIEVPRDNPRTGVEVPDLLKLAKKKAFVRVRLGPIYPGKPPPGRTNLPYTRNDCVVGVVGVGDRHHIGFPSKENPTTSTHRRKVEEAIKGPSQTTVHGLTRNHL
jgi:hypothetical protein